MSVNCERLCIEQGSQEWLELRKTKITATDAAAIMGLSPWKSKHKLFQEKTSDHNFAYVTPAMQRGIDMEPYARLQFTLMTGHHIEPAVFVKDWQMASLDGISDDGSLLVEIKCPGNEVHEIATQGKIPEYYKPQLQHQLHVTGLDMMFYFSFDGTNGVIVPVFRDQEFIDKMNIQEKEFYDCLTNNTAPIGNDFVNRVSEDWIDCATRYARTKKAISDLQKEEEFLRNQLIFMASDQNSKGSGITVSKITMKGHIDFGSIPEIKNVDLEKYRKPSQECWRVVLG